MDVGRELDVLVAEKVFRYTLDYEFADMYFDGAPCVKELRDQYDEWGVLPKYFTEMGDAWLVVEALRGRGLHLQMNDTLSGYRARFFTADDGAYYQFGETAPEAICRAALAAMEKTHGNR